LSFSKGMFVGYGPGKLKRKSTGQQFALQKPVPKHLALTINNPISEDLKVHIPVKTTDSITTIATRTVSDTRTNLRG